MEATEVARHSGELIIANLWARGEGQEEKRVSVLIDTGASVNIITNEEVERLRLKRRRLQTTMTLGMANNASSRVTEYVEFELRKGTAEIKLHAVVLDAQYAEGFSVILGRPAQRWWNMRIDERDEVTVGVGDERETIFRPEEERDTERNSEKDSKSNPPSQAKGKMRDEGAIGTNRGTRRAMKHEADARERRAKFETRNAKKSLSFSIEETEDEEGEASEAAKVTSAPKKIEVFGKIIEVDNAIVAHDMEDDVKYALEGLASVEGLTVVNRNFVQGLLEAMPGLATRGIRLAGGKDPAKSPVNIEATIELTTTPKLPRHRCQQLNEHMRSALKRIIDPMLAAGILKRSSSPTVSRALILPKSGKPGEWRMVVDFRELNSQVARNAYAIPRISQCLATLARGRVFSKLDFAQWFHQIPLNKKSSELTAFTTALGNYEYAGLPQGLIISANHAQKVIEDIFSIADDQGQFDFITSYIDDIAIYSESEEQHKTHLERVLRRLHDYNIQLNVKKCAFFQTRFTFLGHTVDASKPGPTMIAPSSSLTKDILEFPPPRNRKDIQRFVGMVNFYHNLIPKCAELAAPLTELAATEIDEIEFQGKFRKEHQQAFEALKKAMAESPVVALPRDDLPYSLNMDASAVAIGGALTQRDDKTGVEHVVLYISKKFTRAEKAWTAAEKELFGLVYAVRKYGYLFWGSKHPLVYKNDHKPLGTWGSWSLTPKLARWLDDLSSVEWRFEYVPGEQNGMADALSRPPGENDTEYTQSTMNENIRALVSAINVRLEDLPTEEVEDGEKTWGMATRVTMTALRHARLDEAKEREANERTITKDTEAENPIRAENPITAMKGVGFMTEASVPAFDDDDLARVSSQLEVPTKDWLLDLRKALVEDPEEVMYKLLKNEETMTGLALAKNGFVYGLGATPDAPRVLYIPKAATHLWTPLVHKGHKNVWLGIHSSAKTMFHKIRRHFFWPGMESDIENVVRTCDACQRTKPTLKRNYIPSAWATPMSCFEVIAVDEKAGLPLTRRGNASVWVMVDYLSRRVILEPTPAHLTTAELAKVFTKRLISQWGAPRKIVSDRGTQFTSEAYAAMMNAMGTQRALASSGNPKTAAIAERAIRSMLEPIRAFMADIARSNEEWDDLIPGIEFGLNDSVTARTAPYTPFIVSTGRQPRVPIELWVNTSLPAGYDEHSKWIIRENGERPIKGLLSPMDKHDAWAEYEETLKSERKRAPSSTEEFIVKTWEIVAKTKNHFRAINERRLQETRERYKHATTFDEGDWVLVSDVTLKDGERKLPSLAARKYGPYRIVGLGHNNTYKLDANSCPNEEGKQFMRIKAGVDATRSDGLLTSINGEILTRYHEQLIDADFETDILMNIPDWENPRRKLERTLHAHIALHKRMRSSRKGPLKVCDVGSGMKSVEKELKKMFGKGDVEYTGIDMDSKMDPEVLMDVTEWESAIKKLPVNVRARFRRGYFDVIWFSPCCRARSLANTTGERDLEGSQRLVEAGVRLIEFLSDPNDPPVIFMENPESSKYALRNEKFMKEIEERLQLRPHSTTYCKYGYGYKKATTIWANIPIKLLNCAEVPCATKRRLGYHLYTAQAGASRGNPGTPRNEAYTVPPLLMQYLMYQAIMALIGLESKSPMRSPKQ